MDEMRKFRIGDLVRPMESSVADVGAIVNIRDEDYVVVQWHGSNKSTHHCRSLERVDQNTVAAVNPLSSRARG